MLRRVVLVSPKEAAALKAAVPILRAMGAMQGEQIAALSGLSARLSPPAEATD